MAADLGLGVTVALKDLFSSPASKVSSSMKNMSNQAQQMPGKFQKIDQALKAAAGFVIFQKSKEAFRSIISPAADLQAAISQIKIYMDNGSASAEQLNDGLIELSNAFSTSTVKQAQALTQLIDDGISDASKALKAMEPINKAAIVANVDQSTVVSGLTDVMAAYKFEAEDVASVLNKMTLANKLGKISLAEYIRFASSAAPVASDLGVSFDELTAAISVLSNTGLKKSKVFSTISAVMSGLTDNQDKLQRIIKANGFKNIQEMIKSVGLINLLNQIKNKSRDAEKTFQELGITGRNFQNLLPLLGNGFKDFSNTLGEVTTNTTSLDEDFKTATDNAKFTWQQFMTVIENTKEIVGESILITFGDVIKKMSVYAKMMLEYLKSHPKVAKTIGIVVASLATLGIVLGSVAAVVGAIAAIGVPVIVVLAKIALVAAALGAAAYVVYRNWGGIKSFFMPIFSWLKRAWEVLSHDVGAAINALSPVFQAVGAAIIGPFQTAWEVIKAVGAAINYVLKKINELAEKIPSLQKVLTATKNGVKEGLLNLIPGYGVAKSFKDYVDNRYESMHPTVATPNPAGVQTDSFVSRNEFSGRAEASAKNKQLGSVKNPNITVSPPVVNTTVNVPKMKIGTSDVILDKKTIGQIIYDLQQTTTVREGN